MLIARCGSPKASAVAISTNPDLADLVMASALYAAFVGPDLATRLPLVNNPAPVQRRWLAMARVAIHIATMGEPAP